MKIHNYLLKEQLYESLDTQIFRAANNITNQKVIIKLLKQNPIHLKLSDYEREYNIIKQFSGKGIIKTYGLEEANNSLMIILEDFDGLSLKKFIYQHNVSLTDKVNIAINISKILHRVHIKNIVHNEINSSNILINPQTKQIKIIDFSSASYNEQETPCIINPEKLKDHIFYLSPEQTDRMNRIVDHRSDLYSLGIVFYELFTQNLPFNSENVMDIMYSHIASKPKPIYNFKTDLPIILNDIIMILLNKNPEDRYQSVKNIIYDLKKCLKNLKTDNQIKPFPLNQSTKHFSISQKLYGREIEKQIISESFNRMNKGALEIIFVKGYSGIGKTKLVQDICKNITFNNGYFIYGKYDKLQDNISYSGLINALKELMQLILTESENEKKEWSYNILHASGKNAQLVIDMIPEVELIIGPQEKISESDPVEMQNRLYRVVQNLIKAFCLKNHPLTIFLDDLQWIDKETIHLIDFIIKNNSDFEYLLLIGAFRDNEVDSSHPLMKMIDNYNKTETNLNIIKLDNLYIDHISDMIFDSLHEKHDQLAEIIIQKTDGNPFDATELLKSLYWEKLLFFDQKQNKWDWDEEKISGLDISDPIVDILIKRIKKFGESSATALKIASCLGNIFDLQSLSILCDKSPLETANLLQEAVSSKTIIQLFNSRISFQNHIDPFQASDLKYKFAHDRILEAAKSLILNSEAPDLHWRIGIKLHENISSSIKDDYLFIIVNNLNSGKQSSEYNNNNKLFLAELNFIAAKQAREKIAYELSYNYLESGLSCLTDENWIMQYEFTFDLYWHAAEAAYLIGNYEKMNQYIQVLLKHAYSNYEKAKVYLIKIMACASQNRFMEAVEIGISALKLLDVNLPKKISKINFIYAYLKINWLLRFNSPEKFANLPEMTDPEKILILRIYMIITFSAYYSYPELFIFIVINSIKIIKKFGIERNFSHFFLLSFGAICCSIFQKYDIGNQFGKIALQMLKKNNTNEYKSKSLIIYSHFVLPWNQHLKNTLPLLLEAYKSAMESGDLESAANSIYLYQIHHCNISKNLEVIEDEYVKHSNILKTIEQPLILQLLNIFIQSVSNLRGHSNNPCELNGKYLNESKVRSDSTHKLYIAVIYDMYMYKKVLSYLFNQLEKASEYSQIIKNNFRRIVIGSTTIDPYILFDSLLCLALFPKYSLFDKIKALIRIRSNQKKIKKWAYHAKMNYSHKYYLVEAERYRVLGYEDKAIECYDKAIYLANKYEYLFIEALANELSAKFYIEKGDNKTARIYMQDAYECYLKWGADAKVEDLKKRYPHIIYHRPKTVGAIDAAAVLNSMQAISQELNIEKLLNTLVRIAIVNSGAEKAIFLLNKNNELTIAAHIINSDFDQTIKKKSESLNTIEFSKSIVNYVKSNEKTYDCKNASKDKLFSIDPYISKNKILSVLCLPVIDNKNLTGILYLENNKFTNFFTKNRQNFLELLCSQIAISINNAMYFDKINEIQTSLKAKIEKQSADIIFLEQQKQSEDIVMLIVDRFKQPLQIIRMYETELLNYYKNNTSCCTAIENIDNKIKNISVMLDDLLQFNIDHHYAPDKNKISLDKPVYMILSFFHEYFKANEIKTNINIESNLPLVEVNEHKFGQLVINIFSNAKHALEEKQKITGHQFNKEIMIRLSYNQKSSRVIFEVSDNGIGMTPEVLDQCMKPFYTTKQSSDHIGLGLYLVNEIVKKNNMKIEIESIKGEGTIVRILAAPNN